MNTIVFYLNFAWWTFLLFVKSMNFILKYPEKCLRTDFLIINENFFISDLFFGFWDIILLDYLEFIVKLLKLLFNILFIGDSKISYFLDIFELID